MKIKDTVFGEDSVIQKNTDIDNFIPPNPGWNYIRILNHPFSKVDYHSNYYGKWLLFVPNMEFISVFRQIAKLAVQMKLTASLKASGTPERNEHVFCIYCENYKDISFVRKIADVLLSEGLLMRYGYQYGDGTKALFFKTDAATHYKSRAIGQSLTLFKFTDRKELYVKEFHSGNPSWKLVMNDTDSNITYSFEQHLIDLEIKDAGIVMDF